MALDLRFVPLSHFFTPENANYVASAISCPLKFYEKVKVSGQLNYRACRVPVKSRLNVAALVEVTKGYSDTQLLELIKFGWI